MTELNRSKDNHLEYSQYVFQRRSRDASRQALWFLGFLHKTGEEGVEQRLGAFSPFASAQICRLIYNVAGEKDGDEFVGKIPEDWSDIREQARRLFDLTKSESTQPTDEFYDSAYKLSELLRNYIRSRPGGNWAHLLFGYRLGAVAHYASKNLATLIAIAIVTAILTEVDMVRSMVVSHAYNVFKALIVLIVPWIVIRIFVGMKRADPGESDQSTQSVYWLNKPPGKFLLQLEIGMHAFNRPFSCTREPDRLIARWPREQWGLLASILKGRLIKASVMMILVGLGVGFLTAANAISEEAFPDSVLTLYLIFLILALIIIAGRIVDFCEYVFPAPVRLAFLITSLIIIALALLGYGTLSFAVLTLLISGGVFVYWWSLHSTQDVAPLIYSFFFLSVSLACFMSVLQDRDGAWKDAESGILAEDLQIDERKWPIGSAEDGPVVIMAASGGGSRSAVYTAKVLQALYWDHELFNVRIADDMNSVGPVACNLQAISSVSGGSLASGTFIARLYASAPATAYKDCRAAIEGRLPCLTNLEQMMQHDFILPTIQGAMTPFTSRGESIEAFWAEMSLKSPKGCDMRNAGLGNINMSDLVKRWNDAASGDAEPLPVFPIPLFNTTTLEGNNLVISPLNADRFRQREQLEYAEEFLKGGFDISIYEAKAEIFDNDPQDIAWVYYRDAIYGLQDLLPKFDPTLAQSIRASANFPFGFPVIRIQPDDAEQLDFSPKPHQEYIRLTDGGALSNSGMWPLSQLLLNKSSLEGASLNELKTRGVLLIIVEASKMPVYDDPEGTTKLLIGTLNEQAAIAQRMHRGILDLLVAEYKNRIAVVQVDLTPTRNYNVLTTWALDADAQAALDQSFERQWPFARDKILHNWRALKYKESGLQPTIDRERPPVD